MRRPAGRVGYRHHHRHPRRAALGVRGGHRQAGAARRQRARHRQDAGGRVELEDPGVVAAGQRVGHGPAARIGGLHLPDRRAYRQPGRHDQS